jgi:hypothetical protein
MQRRYKDDLYNVIAAAILMAYGTLVMILWPLERLTRRRRDVP